MSVRGCVELVAATLAGAPVSDWLSEADLQEQLHVVLGSCFSVAREQRISVGERPDFVVRGDDGLVAVEVKIGGARSAVLRQIGRYAADCGVDGVVLASTRRTLLRGVPAAIHGKPVAVALIGGVGRVL